MIKVAECGEPLVDVREYCPDVVIDLLDDARAKTEPTAYTRKTVAQMLARARRYLPAGITFVVHDAWRPRSAQQRYFDYYLRKAQQRHPEWSEAKVRRQAAHFAIPPDDKRRAPGHLTGGAIDVSLWSKKAGRRLPMQSRDLSFEQKAHTNSQQRAEHINRNRHLLREAMEQAGFINYPKEFWHYSYGDVMWAELAGAKQAIYGEIKNDRLADN